MNSIIRISRSLPAPVDGVQPLAELDSAGRSSISPSATQPGTSLAPRVCQTPAELATEYRRWIVSRSSGSSSAPLAVLAQLGGR